MDMQQIEGRSCDELCVIVVDDNPFHARATENTLAKLNFQVMVHTSPINALSFIKHHEQDVDLVLVAVHMKEMHGFEFLGICREMNKNLQVIMMSIEATWPIMQRCVELGARFLVKMPLDTNAICNIWQYLDKKHLRMEKIKNLFKGIQGNTYGVSGSSKEGLENTMTKCGEGIRKKTSHLMWTPFLQKRFLQALELLGDAATPKKIEMLMNVNSIDRKQISAHLQKHRKRVEKDINNPMGTKKCSNNVSSSKPLKACESIPYNNDILPKDRIVEEIPNNQTKINMKETQGTKVYEAMKKALQLGTIFDEVSNDTHFEDVTNKANSNQTGIVKLVTYSDSEDDEEVTVNA